MVIKWYSKMQYGEIMPVRVMIYWWFNAGISFVALAPIYSSTIHTEGAFLYVKFS